MSFLLPSLFLFINPVQLLSLAYPTPRHHHSSLPVSYVLENRCTPSNLCVHF